MESRHVSAYSDKLNDLLSVVSSPLNTGCHDHHCKKGSCLESIQHDYDQLIYCVGIADSLLPRPTVGIQKDWWTSDLSLLKSQSIEIHQLWQLEGRPRNGSTNAERLRVRATYKQAMKKAQCAPKQASWNRLHSAMEQNETKYRKRTRK